MAIGERIRRSSSRPRKTARNLALFGPVTSAEIIWEAGDWSSDSNRDPTFSGGRTKRYRYQIIEQASSDVP
jgi:hypothetical protein